MDTLTFSSPILLRHLTFSEAKKMPITQIALDEALKGLEMTMSQVCPCLASMYICFLIYLQFIELCILLGCDYLEPIKGVGPKSALKLMKDHGSLKEVVAHLREKMAEKAKIVAKEAAKAAEESSEEEVDEHIESEDEAPSGAEQDDNVDEDGKEKKKNKKKPKKKRVTKGTGGIHVPEEWLWEEAKALFEKPDVTPADQVEVSSVSATGNVVLISWYS